MRLLLVGVLGCLTGVLLSSCRQIECDKLNNPAPRGVTRKWEESTIGKDTVIRGDFVLRKGESVDDGKIGVEVVDMFPAKCGFFVKANEEFPQVRLRFFTVPDRRVILDFTFRRGSARARYHNHEPRRNAMVSD